MGTPYKQGYSAELDLHNRLWDKDFVVMRAYKSLGPFDLMAACEGFRPLLIEVKYYKAMTLEVNSKVNLKVLKRLKKTVNINKLQYIAKKVDAYPIIAFKIKGRGYQFYRLDYNVGTFVRFKELGSGIRSVLKLPPNYSSQ